MTTRPYELLARFKADGTVAGVSVRSLTNVNGRDFEDDPEPLSGTADPAYTQFAADFSAAIVAERDSLLVDKSQLETDLAAKTTERDTLADQVTALTSERDALTTERDALTAERDGLATDKTTLTTERDTLTAEKQTLADQVAALQAQLDAILNPPGPDLSTVEGAKQFITNERYAKETGGITVGGQFVSTERDEIGHWFPRFYDAMLWTQGDPTVRAINPDGVYPYKPKDHEPVILSAAQVMRAYQCMAWYINQCFAVEDSLYVQLNNGTLLSDVLAEIPAAWPQTAFDWTPPA